MMINISSSYRRTLEKELNEGKPFDGSMQRHSKLLKEAMNNITDAELEQSLERHMEGWVAVEAGDLDRFDSDPDLESWIQRYSQDVRLKAKARK